MSREMKRVICNMAKYDFVASFIFVLILSLFFNLKIAFIFLLGLMVSLINTSANGVIIEYAILKNKKIFLLLSYIFRIILIILIALPFMSDFIQIISYISGYICHLMIVVIYWVRNEKGSD